METKTDKKQHRFCVIMCGGVGSRFWPFSTSSKPKQFLDFFGSGRSLLQYTFDRMLKITDADHIILVTNSAYKNIIMEQLPEVPMENILLEPARRNTAPCVCWAANHIYALDPEASIVTLPSDHLILKEAAFHEAIINGLEFVEGGDRLLTIGLKPSSPHTGYGYIQRGQPVEGMTNIMKVKSFTEKPDLEMAKVFLSTGEFFWNSGMFIWRADSILNAFEKYAKETASLFNAGKQDFGTQLESAFIDSIFPNAPSISIDYAIMEKANNVYVETADLGWSDLGSWNALYDCSPKTMEGNVTQNCKVLAQNCNETIFAASPDKIVVACGLDGYIVADNGNTLLIYPRNEEQNIKQVVNDVKARFGEDYV
ncbi:MAG: mannose-1-phosphate guanylyltransferase [Candidatus Amulumruptor caecigallinarius]|nr:mannose-1-phosphate guanylyltransferase [Candidatus Amulumruptor caecigallinarius]